MRKGEQFYVRRYQWQIKLDKLSPTTTSGHVTLKSHFSRMVVPELSTSSTSTGCEEILTTFVFILFDMSRMLGWVAHIVALNIELHCCIVKYPKLVEVAHTQPPLLLLDNIVYRPRFLPICSHIYRGWLALLCLCALSKPRAVPGIRFLPQLHLWKLELGKLTSDFYGFIHCQYFRAKPRLGSEFVNTLFLFGMTEQAKEIEGWIRNMKMQLTSFFLSWTMQHYHHTM